MTSLREKYEKWELIVTPIISFIAMLVIILFSQNFLGLEDSINFFLFPFFIGFNIGIIGFVLMEKFWLKATSKTMSKFLRIPTYILGIVAIFSMILTNYDLLSSLFVLMTGMGAMVSLINAASLITFYRDYFTANGKSSHEI